MTEQTPTNQPTLSEIMKEHMADRIGATFDTQAKTADLAERIKAKNFVQKVVGVVKAHKLAYFDDRTMTVVLEFLQSSTNEVANQIYIEAAKAFEQLEKDTAGAIKFVEATKDQIYDGSVKAHALVSRLVNEADDAALMGLFTRENDNQPFLQLRLTLQLGEGTPTSIYYSYGEIESKIMQQQPETLGQPTYESLILAATFSQKLSDHPALCGKAYESSLRFITGVVEISVFPDGSVNIGNAMTGDTEPGSAHLEQHKKIALQYLERAKVMRDYNFKALKFEDIVPLEEQINRIRVAGEAIKAIR